MRRYQLIPSLAVQTLRITSSATLPTGEVSAPYTFTFNAIGGVQPYAWSGVPPSGLTLSSAGNLSGTPLSAASTIFNVTVTDQIGSTFPLTCSITIVPAVSIATASLPSATQGSAYTFTMAAQDGIPGYVWALLSQTGVNGWSLSVGGVISGTPATAETDVLNVQVMDSLGIPSSRNFNLTVVPSGGGALTVVAAGGLPVPQASVGVPYELIITCTNPSGSVTFSKISGPAWGSVSTPAGLPANSCLFSGTPASISAGDIFVVQATDAALNVGTITF
jgi:large repetitive protein